MRGIDGSNGGSGALPAGTGEDYGNTEIICLNDGGRPGLREIWAAFYAKWIYLPASSLSRRWKEFRNRLRKRQDYFVQRKRLPSVSWTSLDLGRPVRFLEREKANGNIRISELAILCGLSRRCAKGQPLMEIGTFDGRTTLNLALNAPSDAIIYTLDLPSGASLDRLDKKEKGFTGIFPRERRYHDYPCAAKKIVQLTGDSTEYDFSWLRGRCSLVFVDGSHAYDLVKSDTSAALEMVAPGGIVLWHDYGVWKGVTAALDEIREEQPVDLRSIRGTSLVAWRKPAASSP